ncbi:hypothetical protein AB2N08_11990 [Massilia aurea]|uniref:hypothetical protein n=1 Tax=Massilia aurea TaxID=373040 RepID=UPI0034637884
MLIDLDKFTKHLRSNALPKYGKGRCGEYVRKALQAGGADFNGKYPPRGKEYGPALEMLGFHKISAADPDKFSFLKSDVMVMEPYKGSTAGHVAGYDGKSWISDFVQNDFWAGPAYRKEKPKHAVYRY